MTKPILVRDQRTGQLTQRSTQQYVATFNHGKVEERFFALDDKHASEVAHEVAARRRLLFDGVQLVTKGAGVRALTKERGYANVKVKGETS